MNTTKFNLGDVVNIKSDKNQKMTIEAIRFSNNQSYYTCIWFDLVLDIKRKSFIEYVLETSDLTVKSH
jgi:uncharacterized protein YodC (DUF2158 family)